MRRLLVFNLATDADDQLLSFTTGWVSKAFPSIAGSAAELKNA